MYTQGVRAFYHSSSYFWSFCLLLCVEKSEPSFQSYQLVSCSHAHQEQQNVVIIIDDLIIGGYSINSYLAGWYVILLAGYFIWLADYFVLHTYVTLDQARL